MMIKTIALWNLTLKLLSIHKQTIIIHFKCKAKHIIIIQMIHHKSQFLRDKGELKTKYRQLKVLLLLNQFFQVREDLEIQEMKWTTLQKFLIHK